MGTVLAILIGWIGGAGVNYIADGLPSKRRLTRPHCVYCFEHQPLLNYFFWPRYCSSCQNRRPWRVWVVEIVFILTSIWLWNAPHDRLGYLLSFILFIYFGVVVVIDLEHRLILHQVSLVGALLALGTGVWLHGWTSTLVGGGAGFVIMLLFYYFGQFFARLISRLRGELLTEVPLGFGDVNLTGILGLILGWPGVFGGILIAILLGGAFSLLYVVFLWIAGRYRSFMAIPYGPFLVASVLLLIFFRSEVSAVLYVP